MRIGVIASVSHHLESFWRTLGEEMAERGNQVFFAAGDTSTLDAHTVVHGVTRRPSLANTRAPRSIRKWVDQNRLDVVVTNTATVSFLIRHSGIRVPIVYFAHGLHWARESGLDYLLWSAVERASLRNTAGVIVLNREDKGWFERVAPQLPLLQLRYGVGLPTRLFPRSDVPSVNRAVWIGEFSKRKRPEIALRSVAKVVSSVPSFQFSMLGRGVLLKQCKELAAELGIENQVEFPGHVDPAPYLNKSAILIHTASWEGLPRVVLEAMAVGRPVIATDAKGMRGLEGVHLVDGSGPESLAAAIQDQLLLGKGVPSRIPLSHLDISIAAENIIHFLSSVLVGGQPICDSP